MGARILVVDDEPALLRAVGTNLRHHGFQVETAGTGQGALDVVARVRPDVILLDLGLPDMSGLDVIRTIRATASTPIVVLSARGGERDKVEALNLGADDYLSKPFGVDELLARINVALRHAARPPRGSEAIVRAGLLEVDLSRRRVTLGGEEVHLTPTEYDLLKALVSRPNEVVTDRRLMREVWGYDYGSEAHALHVYVARLRKKIEPHQQQSHLRTEPGVGYRFLVDDA